MRPRPRESETATTTTTSNGNDVRPNATSPTTRIRVLELNRRVKSHEKYDDRRFHPTVIGVILVTFILLVSLFIMKVETHLDLSYFEAIYAAFITYSTIGFGDIDIFGSNYAMNTIMVIIYGNVVHIIGYMILSAWVASVLEKCGVRKY